jgi:large subunit ribosomal protein L3
MATDGYDAVQLGFDGQKERRLPKAVLGHIRKHGGTPLRRIREFREFSLAVKPGDVLGPAVFTAGDFVDAIGVTKGRGFEGVVKRHHFRGGDLTHGAKGWHRRGGAIGNRLFPGTVRRGLPMPGHMGQVRRTVQNLEVVQVMEADNLLLVKGAIPGACGDYVVIRESKKIPKTKAEQRRQALAAAAKAKAAAKPEGKAGARSGK